MIRELTAYSLVLLATTTTFAQLDPVPIQLNLHPQRLTSPVLRYRLLPELRDQKPGDAAALYKRAGERLEKLRPKGEEGQKWNEQVGEWQEMPLAELPRAEVRKALDRYQDMFDLLDQAARCDRCDWELTDRIRKKGFAVRLPELQLLRECAGLLWLRIRLEIAEGKLDRAHRDLQTGLALAHHVGAAPTLINALVGIAVASIMASCLDEFIQGDQAPNLYWALTNLPRPFVDLRSAFQGERLMAYGSFPGLGEAAGDLNHGPLSEQQMQELAKFLRTGIRSKFFGPMSAPLILDLAKFLPEGLVDDNFKERVHHLSLGRVILEKHETAKRVLIEQAGRPRELVEAMPHLQVAALHALYEYDQMLDEIIKWQGFPYWETQPQLLRIKARYEEVLKKKRPEAPAIPLAGELVGWVDKMFFAQTRLGRRFAPLRCIEAIRLHAAANGGKLPASLDEIKEVPIPIDPLTGKNFVYKVEGEKATLYVPPPDKERPGMHNSLIYEITLRGQGK